MNPRRPNLYRDPDAPTSFVPMAAVREDGKGVCTPELKPYREVAKGYTFFTEGDVLFAKITPCMQNGKHAVATGLVDGIGFGTTEFHVLRPDKQRVSGAWVQQLLLLPEVLRDAARHFTGAVGQQRVPPAYLEKLEIPLPPLSEQQRIVTTVAAAEEQIDRAANSTAAQIQAAAALSGSYLRYVFTATESETLTKVELGRILQLRQEVVHPRDHPVGSATFVGLEHIESGTGTRIGELKVRMEQLTGRKPRFHQGDIVYGYLRPYLNKVWIAEFDGLCSVDQYVYRVVEDVADSGYVAWFIRSPVYLERAPISTSPGQLPRIRVTDRSSVIHVVIGDVIQSMIGRVIQGVIGGSEPAHDRME